RERQSDQALEGRDADRQRSRGAEVREHGGQRSATRRRRGHVRQRRPKRAGGRGDSDHQNRQDDGGRNGGLSELIEIASAAVKLALASGATDAECTVSEGEEFSVGVRMREVEKLQQAGSRGVG